MVARFLTRLALLFVIAAISAFVRHQYGGQLRDAIHNFVVNRSLGTQGVDYASKLRPMKFESVKQVLQEQQPAMASDPVAANNAAAAKAFGAGSAKPPDQLSKKNEKTVQASSQPRGSTNAPTARATPTGNRATSNGTTYTVSSNGVDISQSPFDKRSNLYQHRRKQTTAPSGAKN